MAKATCSVDACDRDSRTRGWCKLHYGRWLRTGSVGDARARVGGGPAAARFWDKVDRRGPDDCWRWLAYVGPDGYGKFSRGRAIEGGVVAHRWAYEHVVGPIPDGLEIDHLCRNRACVNPAHLEAVTRRTNQLRGLSISGRNARKTHCVNGHPLYGDNAYYYRGARHCRACRAASLAALNARQGVAV